MAFAKTTSPPRRVLIATTSASAPLHEGHDTGVLIAEALHPFNVFTAAGFEEDIASEKETYTLDWLSLQPDSLPEEEKKQYDDVNGEFRTNLDSGATPDKLNADDYGIFLASAGHAPLIDYPTATGFQAIASKVYANAGIMGTVYHGPAIFPGGVGLETGEPIVEGKTIAGFTIEGEHVMNIMDTLRGWGSRMVDERAADLGATYERPAGVWDSFYVTDGRVITGTNPASSTETAKAIVQAFKKL